MSDLRKLTKAELITIVQQHAERIAQLNDVVSRLNGEKTIARLHTFAAAQAQAKVLFAQGHKSARIVRTADGFVATA